MIPCANPLAGYQHRRQAILDAVTRVLDRGHYILGSEVAAFEQSFADYCGAAHAIGVNSGTDALILALRALGVGPGDEVITVSQTALATLAAVVACGATPVIVDIEPGYWTLDPAALEPAITAKTRAIVPVHLYGQPADLDAIVGIARRHGIPVVEDCAQATGATYKGRRVGSIGDAGCFSFYPTKNLGALGDGGAVVTSSAELADRVRRLRQYGWDEARNTRDTGVNSRLDEVQAAILNVRLPGLDADNGRRRAIARRYEEHLAALPLELPRARAATEHVYHLYVVASAQRDLLKDALAARGVMAGLHYPRPAHRHSGYDTLCRIPAAGLPVTERLVTGLLSLPMYPELSDAEAGAVVQAVADAVGPGVTP
jgi:dTDP-4-amino-4,6-dideoxygalactose transaminase